MNQPKNGGRDVDGGSGESQRRLALAHTLRKKYPARAVKADRETQVGKLLDRAGVMPFDQYLRLHPKAK